MKRLFLILSLFLSGMCVHSQNFPEISTEENAKWYLIQFMNGGNALTAESAGAQITTATATGSDAQLWKISDAGNGYYYIVSKLDPCLVLDVWNKGSKNGTNVHVWENNGSAAQLWKLIK